MSSSALKMVSPLCLMCLFDMPAISALQDGKRAGIEKEELECLLEVMSFLHRAQDKMTKFLI